MAQRRSIDFVRIAARALDSLESLCAEWLPDGRREGHEWKARNPTRADARIGSFSINLKTGAWADFATEEKGGDAIALYAYLNGVKQLEAARVLAKRLGLEDLAKAPGAGAAGQASEARKRGEWDPIVPAPAHAGELPAAHPHRGRPQAKWIYRTRTGEPVGAVYRFETSDGGKEILPCVYARKRGTGVEGWRWLSFPDPRPLYGLEHLRDEGTVLVVEGEKCADAARSVLPAEISTVTWPGGSKAVDKADWSPLRDRTVIIWPDCDAQRDKTSGELYPEHAVAGKPAQPGIRAAERIAEILQGLGARARIVAIPPPGSKPAGWDVADAIAEGWTPDQVRAFVRDNLRAPRGPVSDAAAQRELAPEGDAAPWESQLQVGRDHAPVPNVPNAYIVLANHASWRNAIAFDDFAQRVVKRSAPPYPRGRAGEWESMDDSFTSYWLATKIGMPKLSTAMAAEAVEMAARDATFDPVTQFLDGLTWDRTPRLDTWLSTYFGAPASEYARLVGRWWGIGMVRRAFEPGSKFDFMPILEGPQGRGKSTALEILASPWFGNTDFVMGDKDSMSVIQGKWLYEIAELDSFNKADTTRVKSFVSRQVDEFRPPYGRRVMKLPRRVVLVGTTNQFEYFKDASGNRRFWPIKCLEAIDLEGLKRVRDQLLAEALVAYRAGERCYPTREEQEALFVPEQETREIVDAWEDGVHRFLENPEVGQLDVTSSFDILVKGLHLDAGKITKDMTIRVGLVMRKLGWIKKERRGEHPRYVYERPKKSASETGAPQAGRDDDVPF